jgi:peptide/nickel transport system permease protein
MDSKSRFIIQRLTLTIVSIIAVITILFLMFRLMPGDPSTVLVSPRFSAEQREALLARYGLTEPLHIQYIKYWQNLLQGSLGISFQNSQPVLPLIIDKTLNTLAITLPAVVLAFVFGPLIGTNFAWHRNGRLDNFGTGLVLVAYAAPVFWTGMLAIMVFSFYAGWLPVGGMRSVTYTETSLLGRFISWDFLRHATLPLIIFFLWRLSGPTLVTRNTMIDIIDEPFIRLKRAEGLSERRLKYAHATRNSLLPLVHLSALALGFAFGGSIILETVFSWPGLGRAMWDAVLASDYPMAQGAFIMISMIIILLNFVVDVISVFIDPRVASEEIGS